MWELLGAGDITNTAPLSYSEPWKTLFIMCDTLHDLVPFVQFKKREKTPMDEY